MTIHDFDDIRPWEVEDLPAVLDRLQRDQQFRGVLAAIYKGVDADDVVAGMRTCTSMLELQKKFVYDLVKSLLARQSDGCDISTGTLDGQANYTFVSNHRDIVLDSALLDVLLIDAGFRTTCEIAIGDNLLSLPWVKDVVRLNKAFIVERNLPMRQLLLASRKLSQYMHFAIAEKHENIWIAQREGRAKDSDDRTQEAVLKMMAMSGGQQSTAIPGQSAREANSLMELHIVPTAISYEYDPCDYLKARELQQRRDDPDWHKAPGDDIKSMATGIMGRKGRIHYHLADCLDPYIRELADTPKNELFQLVAKRIDHDIFAGYRLYPINYIAADKLSSQNTHRDLYTEADEQKATAYLATQMAKIELPNADEDFLRRALLTMYANPVKNHEQGQNEK